MPVLALGGGVLLALGILALLNDPDRVEVNHPGPTAAEPPPQVAEDLSAPMDVSAPPRSAMVTPSGLAFRVLKAGTGTRHPQASDRVQVHYSGWAATDGRLFDSSVERGKPATFPLDRVIRGWPEGVQVMVEGEKTRFWIPSDMAYGDSPEGSRPGGMLVFDIELLAIHPQNP